MAPKRNTRVPTDAAPVSAPSSPKKRSANPAVDEGSPTKKRAALPVPAQPSIKSTPPHRSARPHKPSAKLDVSLGGTPFGTDELTVLASPVEISDTGSNASPLATSLSKLRLPTGNTPLKPAGKVTASLKHKPVVNTPSSPVVISSDSDDDSMPEVHTLVTSLKKARAAQKVASAAPSTPGPMRTVKVEQEHQDDLAMLSPLTMHSELDDVSDVADGEVAADSQVTDSAGVAFVDDLALSDDDVAVPAPDVASDTEDGAELAVDAFADLFISDDERPSAGDPVEEEDGEVENTTVPTPSVLDVELQHASLQGYYSTLVLVPSPASMVPHAGSRNTSTNALSANFGQILEALDRNARARLRLSLRFAQHLTFINIACLAPGTIRSGFDCAQVDNLPGRRDNAILTLTGLCSLSQLSEGTGPPGFKAKKIWVRPFQQEYELFQACIGAHFGVDTFHAPCDGGAVAFQTRKEDFQQRSAKASGNTHSSSFTSPAKSTTVASASSSSALGRLSFLPYQENVPVYDGRARVGKGKMYNGFAFRAADWDGLTSLDRFTKAEVPVDTLVTVGFTLSGWPALKDAPYFTAHFNLLFVILLTDPIGNGDA